MLGQSRLGVSLALLASLTLGACGGGDSSSGGSSGGPVNTANIVATQDWVGGYELTDGPPGTDGSGRLEVQFTGMSGSSSVFGRAAFLGDGCVVPSASIGTTLTGTIDPANGNTKLTVKIGRGVTASLTGTATADEIRGTLEASGGPCSDSTQNAEGSWFINPK